MTQVKHGDTVQVHYAFYMGADRTTVGTTAHRVPVEFTIGAVGIILGLEEAVRDAAGRREIHASSN